ncbi:HpcH/HpaI aldolase/citrate lyase family protein [Alloalcanivorax mobilis]|uniref:HpcH/HpaI aldolase/citrate lyase family protein n=1 Tax=Alloalcanivorax mobilis TaxID=2019569 RepID=UPI000B5B2B37|nr:CoA ester lyase [Alloalcanivorax mobilis]ASK33875.1 CoA ester lyase [Alcanivorax sp. N3-2A]|tara:strand:+ start:51951 stop:52778 length:828 start_codon:yes stop_codon:yes gene_type:complete
MAPATAPLRSALFVPASRPERIVKALASGADAVIVDLEDAVPAANKEQAREQLRHALQTPGAPVWVRVNAVTSAWFQADLQACADSARVATIMVPKTESRGDLERAGAAGKPLCALIESAAGLTELASISAAPGLQRLAFGALDLALDLNLGPGSAAGDLLDALRAQLVVHSRARRLNPPLESVEADFRHPHKTSYLAQRAAQMGFAGMLCIHPSQIEPVHNAFRPATEQLDWARRVLDAVAHHDGAFQLDGEMVDEPVIARARRLLAENGEGVR